MGGSPSHGDGHGDAPRDAARDKSALRLWLRLLGCVTAVEKELGARLRRRFDMSLSRFDVLAQLDRAPRGLTMGQLSSQVMVTNGNITVLVKGLEAAGLVTRVADTRDRRIAVVTLTSAGRARFRAMARAHEGWVAELLGDVGPEAAPAEAEPAEAAPGMTPGVTPGVTIDEQDAIMRLLDRVKQSAQRAAARRVPAGREASP